MAPHVGGTGKESGTALILGGATAGVLELFTFHPIDTVAKRLMTSKEKVGMTRRLAPLANGSSGCHHLWIGLDPLLSIFLRLEYRSLGKLDALRAKTGRR
jgi:hypothetical protein